MRKPEQRLWDRARGELRARGMYARRIENVVVVGMPDVLVRVGDAPDEVVTFLELKHVNGPPARRTTPLLGERLGLSREQRNWHLEWRAGNGRRAVRGGGRSASLVGVGSSVVLCVPGRFADEVNRWTLDDWRRRTRGDWDWAAMVLGWRAKE